MPAINDDLLDKVLSFQLELRRMEAGTRRKVIEALLVMQKQLIAEIAGSEVRKFSKDQARRLLTNLTPILSTNYDLAQDILNDNLDDVARVQVAHEAQAMNATIFQNGAVKLPSPALINRVSQDVLIPGGPLSSWWRKQKNDVRFKLSGVIQEGILLDETNDQIISKIIGRGNNPGILPISRNHASSIVATATQQVANDTRLEVFKQNRDVIPQLSWLTALDARVCPLCIARSGKRWRNVDGFPGVGHDIPFQVPPIHFKDRCLLIAVTATFKELGIDLPEPDKGERASSLGPVDDEITFDEYLKRVPLAQQDRMLGKGRAQLWREGKISLSQLVDGQGRELTLAQIISRNNLQNVQLKPRPFVSPRPRPLPPAAIGPAPVVKDADFWVTDSPQDEWHKPAFTNSPLLVKNVMKKYDSNFKGIVFEKKERPHFKALERKINMTGSKPTTTAGQAIWRHEYGHYLDYELGRDKGGVGFKNNVPQASLKPDFIDAVKKDAKTLKLGAGKASVGTRDIIKFRDEYRAKTADIIDGVDLHRFKASRGRKEYIDGLAKDIGVTPEQYKTFHNREFLDPLGTKNGDAQAMWMLQSIKGGDANLMDFAVNGSSSFANIQKISRKENLSKFSDLVGSASSNRVLGHSPQGFGGHSDTYYKKYVGLRYTEIFANMVTLTGANDPVWDKALEKFTPNILKEFKKEMTDALK